MDHEGGAVRSGPETPDWLHKYCAGMPAGNPEEASRMLREYARDVLKDGSLVKTLKHVTGGSDWRDCLKKLSEWLSEEGQ